MLMGAPGAREGHAPSAGPRGVWGRPARCLLMPPPRCGGTWPASGPARAVLGVRWGLSPPRGAWPSRVPCAGPHWCRRLVWLLGPTSASQWPSRGPCEQEEGGEWGTPPTPAPRPPPLAAVGQPGSCLVRFRGGASGGDVGGRRTVAQGPKRQGAFWSFLIPMTLREPNGSRKVGLEALVQGRGASLCHTEGSA